MSGRLLVSVIVGLLSRARPLMSIWPNVCLPPVTGLVPVMWKLPSVGIGTDGAGSGGSITSH